MSDPKNEDQADLARDLENWLSGERASSLSRVKERREKFETTSEIEIPPLDTPVGGAG